jgi:hypothetical protein
MQAELTCAQPIAGAKQTTHLESNLDDVGLVNGKLPVALGPQQIKTFRLLLRLNFRLTRARALHDSSAVLNWFNTRVIGWVCARSSRLRHALAAF